MNTNNADAEVGTETTAGTFFQGQRVLNRYLLQRILGQGGMGIVWLAHDEQLDRDVALKFLPPIVVNDRASLHDLKRETRRSLALTHPNIVRTYDFVQDGVVAGISMEYVEGGTLRHRRIDQPGGVFAPEALGCWVGELCAALDYAHFKASIVHRDLKPANLMIDGREELKVADFGIARSLVDSVSQMTAQRGISGTLVYMSPQQLCGDTPSPLDDIYALGATLFELLTTKPPFYSGDVAGQVANRAVPTLRERRESFGLPAGNIPENWEAVVAACLAKDASLRPQSAGEVAVRLGLATAAATATRGTAAAGMGIAAFAQETGTRLGEPATLPAAPPTVGTVAPTAPGVPPTLPPNPLTSSTQTFTAPPPLPPRPASRKTLYAVLAGVAAVVIMLFAVAAWFVGSYFLNDGEKKKARPIVQNSPVTVPADEDEGRGRGRGRANESAAARGSLVLQTEPAGATVKIGNAAPLRTPATFKDLSPGKYPVEIALDGYEPISMQAEVKDSQATDLGTLTLKAAKGTLRIVSTPAGLAYELKNKANPSLVARGVTPASVTDIPLGDYEITTAREGWPAQQQSISVTKQPDLAATFEFRGGTVRITSEPDGATVRAGTKDLGKTPLDLSDLSPGEVNFTIVRAGYQTATLNGTVQPGGQLALHATLGKNGTTRNTASTSPRQPSNSSSNSNPRPKPSNEPSGTEKAGKIIDLINRSGFPHHRPF